MNYTDDYGDYYKQILIETGAVELYKVWLINEEVQTYFLEGME